LKITAITLRMLPLVFGARASDFSHCSIVKEIPLVVISGRVHSSHFDRICVLM
jgi:hypothetical protein